MMSFVVLLAAAAVSAEPELAWKETPHSLALVRGEQVVWQFNYKKEDGKPYFHPVTIAGGDPVTDLRPADHFWHKAIWFSWKTINGVLYWEEDPKTGKSPGETEVVDVQATPRDDHSARFELALSYHPPGQPAVLVERRIVEVSAPTADGAYHIDWQSTFTAGEADVVLDRTPIAGEPNGVSWGGYAGLSLRLVPGTSPMAVLRQRRAGQRGYEASPLDRLQRAYARRPLGRHRGARSSAKLSAPDALVLDPRHAVLQSGRAVPQPVHAAGKTKPDAEVPDAVPARGRGPRGDREGMAGVRVTAVAP